MTQAPERIWATTGIYYDYKEDWSEGEWSIKDDSSQSVEYIRADLARHLPDVYVLAEIIRRVDGNNDLGAAALAELILKELE